MYGHGRNPKNKFRDTKAEELIDRIDYDFRNAKKDTAMSGGIVARSVVFDELVSDFIRDWQRIPIRMRKTSNISFCVLVVNMWFSFAKFEQN